jgi:DNA-binding NarL/FixJ family response regulator
MDGQGFHRGLRGPQIPVEAQIIAAADRFDHLTQDRPGHTALSADEAVREIGLEAGGRLAPDAVQALADEIGGVDTAPRKRMRPQEWPSGLTDREVEVLRLVAQGRSRKEAARQLFVTEGTVRSHLEHIYSKTGASNRSTATLFAMEHGLLK